MKEKTAAPTHAQSTDPQAVELGFDPSAFDGLHLSKQAHEYLFSRWLGEVRYFTRATRSSRRKFYALTLISICASSLAAVLAGASVVGSSEGTRFLIATLSLLTALSTALLALDQSWSNWKRRSMTLERLRSEGRLFLLQAGHYKAYQAHQDAFDAFALKVEAIVHEHKTEFFSKEPESSKTEKNRVNGSHGKGEA